MTEPTGGWPGRPTADADGRAGRELPWGTYSALITIRSALKSGNHLGDQLADHIGGSCVVAAASDYGAE